MTVTSCSWIPDPLERSEVSANIRAGRGAVGERPFLPAMEPWLRKGRQAHDPPITSSFPAAGFTRPGRRGDARRRRPGRRRRGAGRRRRRSRVTSTPRPARPCVAAHSTTRALYAAYNGPLYQVRRASDNATTNIGPLSAGGVANAAAQDSFCAGTTCVITEIYDQSGHGNNLTEAPGGRRGRRPRQPRERDRGADHGRRPQGLRRLHRRRAPATATTAPRASPPATTPRASTRSSTARTSTAAAASTTATPRPTTTTTAPAPWRPSTSATSRSGASARATARGSWPTWRTACSPASTPDLNSGDPTINYRFTTAMIEGEPNQWAILGGNAQSGGLSTVLQRRPPLRATTR